MMSVTDEYDVFRCVSLCEMSLKGWYWKIFQIPLRLRTKKKGGGGFGLKYSFLCLNDLLDLFFSKVLG